MILKYDIEMDNKVISDRLQNLINQIYKLLPSRQEGLNWEKPLQTVLEELAGIQRLMDCGYSEIYFPLLSKLEGLYATKNFMTYRTSIFSSISLLTDMTNNINVK